MMNAFENVVSAVISMVDNTLKDIAGTQITASSEMTNVLLDIRGYMTQLNELEKVDA